MNKILATMALVAALTACTTTQDNQQIISKSNRVVENRKMTPELLWSFGQLSDAQVSPDGTKVCYGVRYNDIPQNKGNREIFVCNIDGTQNTQITHSAESELKKLKVGQIIKKGKVICYEGTDGNATGNHIHLTVGIAPYKGLYENSNGKWCFTGESSKKPEQLFYVNTKFTKVINQRSLSFKTITTDKVVEKKQSAPSFLPKRGYFRLGDVSKNVGKIASFMYKTFPAYTKKSALGNLYGVNLRNAIKEFQKRTKLSATGNVDSSTLKKLEKYGFKY